MAKQPKRKSYKSVLWPTSEHRGATVASSDLGEALAVIEVALKKAGLSQVGIDVRHRPTDAYPPVLTFARYLEIARNALAVIDDAVWVVERLDRSIADALLMEEAERDGGTDVNFIAWQQVASALDRIARNQAVTGRAELAWARRVVRGAERAERRQAAETPEAEDGQEGE